MKIDPNEPAIPTIEHGYDRTGLPSVTTTPGLTKHEYFTALAMQSFVISTITRRETLLSKIKRLSGIKSWQVNHEFNKENIARVSVEQADALIKELNK